MLSTTQILDSLDKILEAKEPIKIELIKSFQNKLCDDESIEDESINEMLSEFAYDLDFYEPNEEWRKESLSYYGEEKLEEIIKTVIQKLQEQNPD